ncbi:MAG: glycosyltransferase [Candidatus Undinarchaeales archaeon]
MNIGFFTDTYFPQVNGVTYTLHAWKKEFGDSAKIFYPSSKYEPKKGEIPFPSIKIPFYQGYRFSFPFGISKASEDLDIVHIHGLFSMGFAGKHVAKKHNLPKVLTYHTPVELYSKYLTENKKLSDFFKGIYRRWEKYLLNSCDLITVPSEPVKEYLNDRGISNVKVLSNGIDTNLFKPRKNNDFRKKHNLKGKVIGYCGRIGFEKKLEDLIGIAPEFDGTILIAGDGPALDHYKKLAEDYSNVKFLGFIKRENLSAFYSALDLFVFPSVVETEGLVALESFACRTPVVGANALALKDTIKSGKTGYLYEPGNKKDLEKKIKKAYKNRKKLSKNAVKFAKTKSLQSTTKKLSKLYADLI